MKMIKLYEKYREIIVYLIVGVMTTIFSWGICFVAKFFLDSNNEIENLLINIWGWIGGVLFSYPLNRKWIFKSQNKKILEEFIIFSGSRVFTLFVDIIIMWFFVNICPLNKYIISVLNARQIQYSEKYVETLNYWIAKICISSVAVTVLNYIVSKLVVFKRRREKMTIK